MTHPKQPERIYEDVCVAASVCVYVCGKSIFMDYERINLSWKNIVSSAPAHAPHTGLEMMMEYAYFFN